jgi:hypothetical protein
MVQPVRDVSPESERDARRADETPLPVERKPSLASFPAIADRAEWSDAITPYDRQHFITYARLLDAERDKIDWREGARAILLQDPARDPKRAWVCWETHLARARWIASAGFQHAIVRASAQ